MLRSVRRACSTLALTFAATAGFGSGCASLDASKDAAMSGGQLGDGGRGNEAVLDSGRSDARDGVDARVALNDLCGAVGFCGGRIPDDPFACAGYDGGGPRPDGGRDGSTGGAPPVAGDAGDAGAPADARAPDAGDAGPDGAPPSPEGGPDEAADGGSDAASQDAGSTPDAGLDGAPGPGVPDPGAGPGASPPAEPADGAGALPPAPVPMPGPGEGSGPAFACQVGSDDYGNAVHRCGRSGHGGTGAPCASSGDCAAGLACVGAVGAGQCLPYCCDPGTVCPGGGDAGRQTFCGERPLLEGGGREKALQVPVCVPAEECRLDDPFPCEGPGCACSAGMACAVVREDGTTACVTPGAGKVGEACPCAPGYYCAQGQNLCTKLCKTTGTDSGCSGGHCAAASGLPEGFGLCVGAAAR